LDVASDESVKGLAATVDGKPIDLLILNSAIFTRDGNKFGELNFPGWRESFETNVLGAIRVAEVLIENVAGERKKTDRGHQHRNGFARDIGKHDRVWAGVSVQDKQGRFEHGDVDPSQGREATRSQRFDIQPGVGTDGYGRCERRVDAGAEYWRNA
jgi:NAD(P)-dependent dehydrogenase (short-subunit alcohol dehydrogenase family)